MALCAALPCTAEEPRNERWYQERVAAALQGEMEVRVPNGRVDVLTGTHAIEVEFARNWKHAIGQTLWYAMQTNKAPGIVLILERPEDFDHALRLQSTLDANGLKVRVWRWPEDFKTEDAAP